MTLRAGIALSGELDAASLIDAGCLAEELGFGSLWITDQRFFRDPYVLLGALARETARIRLVVGVSDPFSRHPARLAMASATLSEISNGRFTLGLGAGGTKLEAMGVRQRSPLGTLREAIGAIRTLMEGGTASAESAGFVIDEAELGFSPQQIPRIGMVAHGPKMYELAGELADVVCVANYLAVPGIEWAIRHITAGSSRSGNDPELVLRLDGCVAEDRQQAFEVMERRVRKLLEIGYYGESFLAPIGMNAGAVTPTEPGQVSELRSRVALAGDAEEAAAQLAPALSACEWSEICVRAYNLPGVDLGTTLGLIRHALEKNEVGFAS